MANSSEDRPIEIAASQAVTPNGVACLAGLASWILVPLGVSATIEGEIPAGLFLLSLPAAGLVLARFLRRRTPKTFAVLHKDRLELTSSRSPSHIDWSQVESIHWRSANKHIAIGIASRTEGSDTKYELIRLDDVASSDQVTLIGYIRVAGRKATQHDWPNFCVRIALPRLKRRLAPNERQTANAFEESLEERPFRTGLALPVTLLRQVSRPMWWTIGTMILLSMIVNIRLIWGIWPEPFTTVSLSFAVGMFAMGVFARSTPDASATQANGISAAVSLFAFIVAMPLLGNAFNLGWIPEWATKLGLFMVMAALFAPLYLEVRRREAEIRKQAVEGSRELQEWSDFEQGLLKVP